MKKPTKRYIVWTGGGSGGYSPEQFDTVEDALLAEKYTSDWYLTEAINGISAYSKFEKPKPDAAI